MGISELIAIYAISGGVALCNEGYISIGVGYAPSVNQPEVTLQTPVLDAEIGIPIDNWALYIRHSSGITVTEEGAGFNLFGIKYTFR